MSIKMMVNTAIFAATGNSVRREGLEYFVDKLKENRPFSFSRFGDGEWSAMLGLAGENCDGHRYFPELGNDLRGAIIEKQDYFYGIQGRAIKNLGRDLCRFLKRNTIRMQWYDSDVFHYNDNAGTLFPLVRQLRTMRVVVIGPQHLRSLSDKVFHYERFIEVPLKNCYLEKKRIRDEVKAYYEKNGPALFSFSASMTTNVIIHELYPLMGSTCWLLDLGSLWDPYVGVDSRGGKSARYWETLIGRNIGQGM